MKIDGVSAIAVVLIASFGIDRIVTGLLFLLSFIRPWARAFPDPSLLMEPEQKAGAERRYKLNYFLFGGALAIVVIAFIGDVRMFHALGFDIYPVLDSILTGLIMLAGADRVAELLKLMPGSPGGAKQESRPIEITGRLILEGERGGKAGGD